MPLNATNMWGHKSFGVDPKAEAQPINMKLEHRSTILLWQNKQEKRNSVGHFELKNVQMKHCHDAENFMVPKHSR